MFLWFLSTTKIIRLLYPADGNSLKEEGEIPIIENCELRIEIFYVAGYTQVLRVNSQFSLLNSQFIEVFF